MKKYKFVSGLAKEIEAFIKFKEASGRNPESYRCDMISFDKFCVERNIKQPKLTQADANAWLQRRKDETLINHYKRAGVLARFVAYLAAKGMEVPVVRRPKVPGFNFRPHIYTDAEISRYFAAVDKFQDKTVKNGLQYPVLFRILYCCGTRLGETLAIKKKDVNLKEGLIYLRMTKGKKERFVALPEALRKLLERYWERCLVGASDEDPIFTNSNGRQIQTSRIYAHHRLFLAQARIPFIGGGEGPRIHDFRHHMAVYSLRQMEKAGIDLFAALPVLSAYLGHENIYATEQYLHLAVQHFPELEKKFGERIKSIFGEGNDEGD